MIILVINCGSSSLKYQVLDLKDAERYDLLAKGLVERIGMDQGVITHKVPGKDDYQITLPIPDHTVGVGEVLKLFCHPQVGILESLDQIQAVGHRVVHGGEEFNQSCLITPEVIKTIEDLCDLAPLHNPANLKGIYALQTLLPQVKQVAVFDTSFHTTMPDYAHIYPLPYEYYQKYKVRKYCFHGTSHMFVSQKAAKLYKLDPQNSKVIVCHLGNGSSITAVQNGKSVDNTLGFTPLEGLMMGTRCGDIDPSLILFLQEKEGLTPNQVRDVINKKSGFLGVSGVSSDCRDVRAASREGNDRARLTLDMFAYRVLKFIGSYAAAMNGVDVIAFTGGIGENDFRIRESVCSRLSYLGVDFDAQVNSQVQGYDSLITRPDSKVKVAVLTTNEELVIATETLRLI